MVTTITTAAITYFLLLLQLSSYLKDPCILAKKNGLETAHILRSRQAEIHEISDDLGDSELVDSALNATVPPDIEEEDENKPKDADKSEHSEHTYYHMDTYQDRQDMFSKYDVDLAKNMTKNGTQKLEHLQDAYRKPAGIKLDFPFPFYGQKIYNVTIATGGFLYVGDQTHSWLAATQYIAPLMANFDTMTNGAQILYAYLSDDERIVFEWSNVTLRDFRQAGHFTFQVSLYKSGDIVFVYKDIPMTVKNISDSHHPCKIGISDAYLFTHKVSASDKFSSSIQTKRVIHEYHRISVPPETIKNSTVVFLKLIPGCLEHRTCAECQSAQMTCIWCVPKSGKKEDAFCSDYLGMHRRRQEFIENSCQNTPKETFYCDASDSANNIAAN